MSSDPTIERMLARYEPKRREALRRILLGTAVYTAPLVASYSMQSLGGDAQAQALCQNQTGGCSVPVPVDSGLAIVAAVGVVGAAGAFMLRRRRERKDRDDKA